MTIRRRIRARHVRGGNPDPTGEPAAGRPRVLVTADQLTTLRLDLASDTDYLARWQTAVTQFESTGGYWQLGASGAANRNEGTDYNNPMTIAFAALLAAVRRSGNDVGLVWAEPGSGGWQAYRDRCANRAVTWASNQEPHEYHQAACGFIYDLLYNDLSQPERGTIESYVATAATTRPYCLGRWDDQASWDHFCKAVCVLASDGASNRVAELLTETQDWADAREWVAYNSLSYEWKQGYPANQGALMCLYLLQNYGGYSDAQTVDRALHHTQNAWQLLWQYVIPHPGLRPALQARTNMVAPKTWSWVDLKSASFLLWFWSFIPGKSNLVTTSDNRGIAGGPVADLGALAASEQALLNYAYDFWTTADTDATFSNVVNFKWVGADAASPSRGHLNTFFAAVPWLLRNVQLPTEAMDGAAAGIPKVRRWWPGTLDLTTVRSGFGTSNSADTLISYWHKRFYINTYEGSTRQNGRWEVHRGGPLLVQRGSASHGSGTRACGWAANGVVHFIDPDFYPLYHNIFTENGVAVQDAGGPRSWVNSETKAEVVAHGAAAEMGQVTQWHADADCVAITSDLTRSYNSTLFNNTARLGAGNDPKVSAFTREFVCVKRDRDGTNHEHVFTFDRMTLTNTRWRPTYNLCPATNPNIDGTETANANWAPQGVGPSGDEWYASGPTRWDYTGATRLIYDNVTEPAVGTGNVNHTTPGTGKVAVTWLTPSGNGVSVTKRGGTNAYRLASGPGNHIDDGGPLFSPWGGWAGRDGEWDKHSDLSLRAYSGLYTVEVYPATVSNLNQEFLIACDVLDASDTPGTAAALVTDATSVGARCGASAVVFSKAVGTRAVGNVTVPSGVVKVVLVNLPANTTMSLTAGAGLSITTPERASGQSGVLVVGVSGAGSLSFDQVAVTVQLSTFMGVGGPTANGGTYRARTSAAALLQLEYGTNADLSGSTITPGVTTQSSDDFTGGETFGGMPSDTAVYVCPRINGARVYQAPFPSFKTAPVSGVDATVKIVFHSCQTSPNESAIYQAMGNEGAHVAIQMGDFGYPDVTTLAAQRTNYQTQFGGDYGTHIVRKVAQLHQWDDHDYGGNNEDGGLSGKANSLQAFKEYRPTWTLVNPSNGIWQSGRIGNVDLFLLDVRYQREPSDARYPNTGPSTTVAAESGTGGATIVLPSTPTDNQSAITAGWYAVLPAHGVYRVASYVHATRTITLAESVSGLAAGDQVSVHRASMLDRDALASDQVGWLVDGINNSTARWKVICTPVIWNQTANGPDLWGGWESERVEQRYLLQHITASNVVVLSGDRHFSALDSGANAVWPEATASPTNNTTLSAIGTWTHGTHAAGHTYGVLEIATSPAHRATFTIKGPSGSAAGGITALTVSAA